MPSNSRFTEAELSAWKVNIQSWLLIERYLDQRLQHDSGMPHAYYAILSAFNDNPNRSLALTRIARHLGYSQSRMSHAVVRLEESGWIERISDPDDRRVTLLHLTDAGRSAYKQATIDHIADVRAIFFSALDDDDLDDLRRIGSKLLASVKAAQPGLAVEDPALD